LHLCAFAPNKISNQKSKIANHLSYIIGISGGSGSGKTTFLNSLKEHFQDANVTFISMDNYYFPRETQVKDENGVQNFDLPTSIDAATLKADIERLEAGESVVKTEYVFNNAEAKPKEITIKPANVYVIEGLFIYHYEEIKNLFNLKLFIHAKDSLKIIRRIKRDGVERNYPLDDVIYRYEHHVLPSYEAYIEKYIDDVDVIINNNKSFEQALDLVKLFVASKV